MISKDKEIIEMGISKLTDDEMAEVCGKFASYVYRNDVVDGINTLAEFMQKELKTHEL